MSVSTAKGRVLCVDDEPNILRALSWLLQKEFEVVTSTSGHEALEIVRKDNFDVVISDQRMPEMSGVDFLREVRAIAPRSMRILLTGYSDMQAVLRSVNESEIFRYINKPWNINDLPKVVAQAAEIARTQPAPTPEPAVEELPLPARDEAKILVIDDDPEMHAAVELSAGDIATVVHVTNVVDAVHALQNQPVGVIVSETRLGSVDLTRLICLMKQRHPQIVTVVLAEETGTDLVSKLINQGQIYRFVPKPVKSGYMRMILRSALAKSHQLSESPDLNGRHQVEALPEAECQTLVQDLNVAAQGSTAQAAPAEERPGLIGGFLKRLFGGAR
ncbi:response regulator [Azospira restricta]|uniref:Response regulator n=2 Tax=Azospira restricta TaxID=404405 RepID=A0A974SSF1_9RHOO|nr:response regulator [Azospira restricta]